MNTRVASHSAATRSESRVVFYYNQPAEYQGRCGVSGRALPPGLSPAGVGIEHPMSSKQAVVVRPGEGHRVGNVEFLARSRDTPRFNLAIITIQPHRDGPEAHVHASEDDAF